MSRKYAPPLPFVTLASVQNTGGAYTRDAMISLAITPSLPVLVKHDLIVGGGVGAKCEASPRAGWGDAHDTTGRLMSFSVEG